LTGHGHTGTHSATPQFTNMSNGDGFPGAVGNVAIDNYLLTENQIAAHFTAMTGRPAVSVSAAAE
jgi:hypothetical protein